MTVNVSDGKASHPCCIYIGCGARDDGSTVLKLTIEFMSSSA